jgi:hypothetical protein
MKCVITERIIPGPGVNEAARRIAHLNGEPAPRVTQAVRYWSTETSEEYLALAGGLAWPGQKPGFAVVIAVMGDGTAPRLKVTAEAEAWGVEELIRFAYDLYEKYGVNCRQIPFLWYGDIESGYSTFIHRFNEELSKRAQNVFFLTPSPHQGSPDAFPLYLQTIYQLVDEKKKRLHFGTRSKLPSYLRQMGRATAHHGDEYTFPAITALGYVVSALTSYTPWLVEVSRPVIDEHAPWEARNMKDPFNQAMYGYARTGSIDTISDM